MKDRIIETAGRSWRLLGERGEIGVNDLSKLLKEKGEVAFQALGWLAREDKITYLQRSGKTFVSLVDSEKDAFKRFGEISTETTPKKKAKVKIK